MNYVISKIELIDGMLVYTPIGYVLDKLSADLVISKYESTLGNFLKQNISSLENGSVLLSDFIELNQVFHTVSSSTTSVEGMGLSEILNLNEYL